MIDYSTLNPEQHNAVMFDHRRILCLAGAGTGKTRVLTHRIARLWESGVSPENMLALTFTRAAGAEMKERVIKLIGDDGKKLFCNTFHAFCADVIREFADQLGYEPNFSIYGQQEADELMQGVIDDFHYKLTLKKIVLFRAGDYSGLSPIEIKQTERAVKDYKYRLKRNNAFDFDELINTVKLALHSNIKIQSILHTRYTHVFVDEFQDTDPEQWDIIQAVAPDHIFIVGDDFQSIYGFRGSDVGIIIALAANPKWLPIKLERNYRSTQPIVAAANALIKINYPNYKTYKTLISDLEGPDVDFREPDGYEAEIAEIIPRLKENQSFARSYTTAIIARTNKQIAMVKARLAAANVPYETISSADNPFNSEKARLLLAWLAAIENPQDDIAVAKIASTRMAKTVFLELEMLQLAAGDSSLMDVMNNTDAGKEFKSFFERASNVFYNEESFIGGIGQLDRYIKNLLHYAEPSVLTAIYAWQKRQESLGEPVTISGLIDFARTSTMSDWQAKERTADKTYLMTAHGSKGLEFDEVYIIGATQGVFPSLRADIKEERRLFYVAMTRAREYLNISSPLAVADWGGHYKQAVRSQFVFEALQMDRI